MQNRESYSRLYSLCIVSTLLSTIAIVLVLFQIARKQPDSIVQSRSNTLERIKKSGVIRAGYGGFPPYTIIDPNAKEGDGRVKGFAIDLMEEIAKRHDPPLKVEWHKINWETLRTDLNSDRIDVLADGLYQTIPLGADFGLTVPFSFFGIGCALVRKDDGRFKNFEDLDRSDIKIALAVGWLSTDYAKKRLKNPTFKDVVVSESPNVQLDEVLLGRVDAAIQDVPTILAYSRAHPDKVKALWIDSPPASVVGGFAVRKQDGDLLDFLNVGMRVLQTDGTIQVFDEKWKGMGYYDKPVLVPGSGLKNYQP